MKPKELAGLAESIQNRLRERGEMSLMARPSHGKVLLEFNGEPFARFHPMSNGSLQLSRYTHRGRWELMSFAPTTPVEAADLVIDVLGPQLQAFAID